MKKKCLALAAALALCLGLLPAPVLGAGSDSLPIDEKNFPDAQFRAVVEALPGAEDGVLTGAERDRITVISCNDRSIQSLEGIRSFTALEELYCIGNQLTALDLSGMPALEVVNCTRNALSKLDVRRCPQLRGLYCSANLLREVNVTGNRKLTELYCDENELGDLDVSHNPALLDLDCSINYMNEVDVSRNPALNTLTCDMMGQDMTIWIPAEGVELVSLLGLWEVPEQITGGSLDENGRFTFDENSDSASFLNMRNTVTLKKPLKPVTEQFTTPEGVQIALTTNHRGRQSAQFTVLENWNGGYVTVPVDASDPGLAAFAVDADGAQKVIPTSVAVENGLRMPVEGNMTAAFMHRGRRFYDVPRYEWFRPYVDFVSARKLFTGVSWGEFGPDVPMTRGMLVVVLHSLEERDAVSPEKILFSDVAEGMWYTNAVNWAALRGVVSGYPDGRFGPDDPITREQLALMLYNDLGRPAVRAEELTFTDRDDVSPYAETAVRWAVENGVLSGVGGNRLSPGGTASRAEASAMLMAYVKLLS